MLTTKNLMLLAVVHVCPGQQRDFLPISDLLCPFIPCSAQRNAVSTVITVPPCSVCTAWQWHHLNKPTITQASLLQLLACVPDNQSRPAALAAEDVWRIH